MTYVDHIRLLSCEFEVQTDSRELMDLLCLVTPRAEQDVPVVTRCTATVDWTGEEFRIDIDGVEDDFELSVTSAVETLCQRLANRAIATLPDHIRVNAATGIHAGSAFLLIGPERSGKTTLALSLMLENIDITGDGLVLLRGSKVIAFPRKFYAREDSLVLLPRLRLIDRLAGSIRNPQEGRVVALDPLELGKSWRIAPAPVSTILYIEPNFGGSSIMRRSGKVEMIQRLLPHCAPPISARRGWLGELCDIVNRAATFVLELGDLDAAVAATIEVLA
ncbi:MAG: hypothetical protein JO081_02570 [Alphaproteobacteria bacterium]|nr:hypothetical protein [Alphaproteobacteria bacterium]